MGLVLTQAGLNMMDMVHHQPISIPRIIIPVVGTLFGILAGAIAYLYSELKETKDEHKKLIRYLDVFISRDVHQQGVDYRLTNDAGWCQQNNREVIRLQKAEITVVGIEGIKDQLSQYTSRSNAFTSGSNIFHGDWDLANHFKKMFGLILNPRNWREYASKPEPEQPVVVEQLTEAVPAQVSRHDALGR